MLITGQKWKPSNRVHARMLSVHLDLPGSNFRRTRPRIRHECNGGTSVIPLGKLHVCMHVSVHVSQEDSGSYLTLSQALAHLLIE